MRCFCELCYLEMHPLSIEAKFIIKSWINTEGVLINSLSLNKNSIELQMLIVTPSSQHIAKLLSLVTNYSSLGILHSLIVSITETMDRIHAIIKFGCIVLNISGNPFGGTTPSGHVPVPGMSNAGKNIPQKNSGLKPINRIDNLPPFSLYDAQIKHRARTQISIAEKY